jgi:two-component system, LuxR family, response regulator FixJ
MQVIPRSPVAPKQEAPKQEAPRGRISIVDDDRSIREALKSLMRSARFDAEVFESAEEFLASGKLGDTACLILDIRLPGMSGLDLQDRLRVEKSGIPIIFISANADDASRQRALKGGAKEFLAKPVRREILFQAIQSAMRS